MKDAPPILGPLDFAGMKNNIILIEHDDDDCSIDLISKVIEKEVNIIFSPSLYMDSMVGRELKNSAIAFTDSIARVRTVIKRAHELSEFQFGFFVINRIDMMDLDFNKKEKGAQTNAYLSMLCSRKLLRNANVIVTSAKSEYKIREIADKFISLRK
jgi:hypothetical protein